jgi:hypothetical protein
MHVVVWVNTREPLCVLCVLSGVVLCSFCESYLTQESALLLQAFLTQEALRTIGSVTVQASPGQPCVHALFCAGLRHSHVP